MVFSRASRAPPTTSMIDRLEHKIVSLLIRRRTPLAWLSVAVTALIALAMQGLYFEADYKIYFQENDPQLVMHESVEDIYTSSDNIAITLRPEQGDVFDQQMLTMLLELTDRLWQTPYVIRVDSITNFQHTRAEGDDLLVEDVLLDSEDLSEQKIELVRQTVLAESQLYGRLISKDGTASMLNVNLELPPEVDRDADEVTQSEQRKLRDESYIEVMAFARDLVDEYRARYPQVTFHLSGVAVITSSFNEVAQQDATQLVPIMYLLILVALCLFLRSVGAVVAALVVIAGASVVTISSAGLFNYALNTVNIVTPTIVLTIAVCDAVHLLSIYLRSLAKGLEPIEAMKEALRLNLQPIVLTSVTTAVGFLTLNFSISPPFNEFGNMTAFGVMWAMLLTFCLLPALSIFLIRKRKPLKTKAGLFNAYADWVIKHHVKALIGSITAAVVLTSMLPLNVINDDTITYFKPGLEYRASMDFTSAHLPGVNDINVALDCGAPSCVNDPEFLGVLDRFKNWALTQQEIVQVSVYSDVIKSLNRSMNGGDRAFYKVPENSAMAAQYNLMYEMSLPYGLDLNNQLNLDKSATKVSMLANRVTSSELIQLSERARTWLRKNYRKDVEPLSGVSLMFANIGVSNIHSMLVGGVYAVLGITFTILIALRSFRYAAISLIPNAVPALMAFGVWGLLVGTVNLAAAAVFSISLGILVDDTVHFISKYRRAREVKGLSPEDAIRYSFNNVGDALLITTLVLCIGFAVLTTSNFALNSIAGSLTAITIFIALVFDFLILPPLLMIFDKDRPSSTTT